MPRAKRVVKTVVVRNQSQRPAPRRRARKPRSSRRRAMVPRGRGLPPLTADYVRSLSDPWDYSACVPDGANGVGCFSCKETFLLGTGATGTCTSLMVNPNSTVNYEKADFGNNSATPTIGGNYVSTSASATISALYSDIRTVSSGIKIRYVGNTQTDQGILIIGQVSQSITPSSFNGTTLTQAQALFQNYKLFPLRSGGSVVWRPQCMDDIITYTSTTTSIAAVSTAPQAPYLLAIIYGANANTSSLAICDVVTNFEGQYRQQTFLPGGVEAMANKAEAGWYESALNAVKSMEPILPFVQSTLVNAFNSPMASTAMGMLLGQAGQRGLPRLQGRNYMQVD